MLWGAFGVTLFGLFLTPVFYSVVRRFTDRKKVKPALANGPNTATARTILDGSTDPAPHTFHANNGEAKYASLDMSVRRAAVERVDPCANSVL
jgi:hypothetical protein